MARIAELQDFLKDIREARKKEEDLEIVRSIRSMKLGARDLFDLLTAIQDGNLSDELREQLLAAQEDEEEENLPDSPGRSGTGADRGWGRDRTPGGRGPGRSRTAPGRVKMPWVMPPFPMRIAYSA